MSLLRSLRRYRAARRLDRARRDGRGMFVHHFEVGPNVGAEDGIATWCRETLARCRRPWGIAHFDLALVAPEGGTRNLSLTRCDPAQLYAEGSDLLLRIREFIEQARRRADASAAPAVVAVALFSWGEAAHAAFIS